MPLQPLSDTVIVQVEDLHSATPDESSRRSVRSGTVVQAGPGHRAEGRSQARSILRPGDRVYFPDDSGAVLRGDEGVVLMVRERDILAFEREEQGDEVPLYVPPPPRAE